MLNFSLFETVLKAGKNLGVPLRSLGECDLGGEPLAKGNTTFLTGLEGMRAWCRENERIVLDGRLRDARIFVGFQRMSRVRGVLRRYQKICATAGELWVFAQEDWRPTLPHARLVAIDDVDLCREWFLLIDSKKHRALLSAREIDGPDRNRAQGERRFEGISVFHAKLVHAASEAIEDWIGSFL